MSIYNKTAREREKLKGAVKQMMVVRYKAVVRNGNIEAGKIDAGTHYDHHNMILTFNAEGEKIKEEAFGATTWETKTMSAKGMPLETLTYRDRGQLQQKTVYIYKEFEQPVETIATEGNGTIRYRTTTTYNEYGQPLEHTHYNGAAQTLFSRTVTEYGTRLQTAVNGKKYLNVTANLQYDGMGVLQRQHRLTYDEHGNKTKTQTIHTDPEKKKYDELVIFVYNEHNDCVQMTYYEPDGSIKRQLEFTPEYDNEGKKIAKPYKAQPDEEESDTTSKLTNDSHGNWIKKVTYSNDIPIHIFERHITYHDDDTANTPPFVHPVMEVEPEAIVNTAYTPERLSKEDAKWMVEAANVTPDNFNILRYYTVRFGEVPSIVNYSGPHIEAYALLHLLKENLNAYIVHSYNTVWNGQREKMIRFTLGFPHRPYLLHATHIQSHAADEYVLPEFLEESPISCYDDRVYFSQFQLLHPAECTANRDDFFEDMVYDLIDKCSLRKRPDKPTIRIIEVRGNNFALEEHPVDDDFEINDLDVHYGYGFQKFDTELMKRFQTQTKGLVLFHGQPGTGKTYYIRHLLRKMVSKNRKIVIYMPPNMVDHLVEPTFMTFLTDQIQEWSRQGFFCVLLIEDAEPLLARRQEGIRIQGITNLLNMSDGLLNDMLNLQIICTFNVDLKKLDSALLRPGRLIARKEFKPLSVLDANLLAQRLGIKHHFTAPATIAEVYSLQKSKNTLVHDVDSDRDSTTLLDDLL